MFNFKFFKKFLPHILKINFFLIFKIIFGVMKKIKKFLEKMILKLKN
jgi:hypothetical protein